MHLSQIVKGLWLLSLAIGLGERPAFAQEPSLEQRQPLELVYADSIVPQDRNEMMLTSGAWYFSHGATHDAMLTQKIEWGISGSLQISTFVQVVRNSNTTGSTATGTGDFDLGARYTWSTVGSRFTHIAVAFDATFPTGNPRRGLGDAAYLATPSVLVSREFHAGRYQLFSTDGVNLVAAHRRLSGPSQNVAHHSMFFDSGLSRRTGHGWAVGELSVSSDRWSGGNNTTVLLTPLYIWRVARRAELLGGVPFGLTSSSDRVSAVIKFTFELGGEPE
jgi:hypothetical protein